MTESEVYLRSKKLLRRLGWTLVGGQPPSGCDHLPVIEIKDPARTTKGSRGAYKPDLVAVLGSRLLLVECKPEHDDGDVTKLRAVIEDQGRRQALVDEMLQRGLLKRHSITTSAEELIAGIEGAVAHAGRVTNLANLCVIRIGSQPQDDQLIEPPDLECHLFEGLE
ncbi:MAG: hypothetical protein U1F44_04160 [Coriobacteriia bacterium]|nr:hypothetical protein [Coriobacteriia bacterium]